MRAIIVHSPNPFKLIEDSNGIELRSKMTINQGLRKLYPNFKKFEKPTICLVNNKPVLRKDWNRKIKNNDNIVFMTVYRGDDGSDPLRIILLIAVIFVSVLYGPQAGGSLLKAFGASASTVATYGAAVGTALISLGGSLLINAVLPPPGLTGPSPANSGNPATVYNINAQGNAARLEQVIPVIYGTHLVYPDFAARPYTEFIENDQYLYELFVIGLGEYDVQEVRIEDTNIDQFKEVDWKVYDAYKPILPYTGEWYNGIESNRLFVRTHVVTASEVNNLELEIQNEWFGPFAVVSSIFKIEKFSVDIVFPNLARIDNDGNPRNIGVGYEIEYREIDEGGRAQGNYVTAYNGDISNATLDPVRRTFSFDVLLARYEVRMRRTTPKSDNSRDRTTMYWAALKGYVAESGYTLADPTDPNNLKKDLTLLAVKIRANSNISGTSSRKINCIVTRKIRILEVDDLDNRTWSVPKPTTNIAWALADICTSHYGGQLSYNRINQEKLFDLSEIWAERGDSFNAVFDRKLSLWEALTSIARTGRSLPVMLGGTVSFIRDDLRTIPSALFSSQNILKDSLTSSYIVPSDDIVDKVSMRYFEQKTWQSTIVEVANVDGEDSKSVLSPEVHIFGVTSKAQAEREGVYLVRTNKLRRKTISFETELEGALVTYGDDIILSHDTPEWGISGTLTGLDSSGKFKTSVPLVINKGIDYLYTVVIRNKDGSLVEHPVSGETSFSVNKNESDEKGFVLIGGFYKGNNPIVIDGFDPIFDSSGGVGTFFSFGCSHIKARVLSVTPSVNKTVLISAVEQDDFIHSSENVINSDILDPTGLVDESDPDVITIEHIITQNQFNYNLFEEVGSPSNGVIVRCTINTQVKIGSISTANAAFYIGGFNLSSIIYLINNGEIYGAGGGGGVGGRDGYIISRPYPGWDTSRAGSPGEYGHGGGDAIEVHNVLHIDNINGLIFGGGGGGGGGGGNGFRAF